MRVKGRWWGHFGASHVLDQAPVLTALRKKLFQLQHRQEVEGEAHSQVRV